MKKMLKALIWKEYHAIFRTPFFYLLMGIFLFILGMTFYNSLSLWQQNPMNSLSDVVLYPFWGNMTFIFLFILPLFTMRSVSWEMGNGQFDQLYFSHAKLYQIVLGKVIGLMMTVLPFLLISFLFPLLMWWWGVIDLALILTGGMGVLLNSLFFISLGIFISSLTKSSLFAGVITFFAFLFLLMLSNASVMVHDEMILSVLRFLSPVNHLSAFSRGLIQSFDILYYVSFSAYFLYLSMRRIELYYE